MYSQSKFNEDGCQWFYVNRKLKTTICKLESAFLNILKYFANDKTDQIQIFKRERFTENDYGIYF
jgi:hypothetical protein